MDSNEQNNISGVLKKKIALIASLLIFIMFISFNNNILLDFRLAYKGRIQSVFNLMQKEINEGIEKNEISDKEDISGVFKEVISNKLNIKINGYEISTLDNNNSNLISSYGTYSILQDICINYIKELGLDMESIIDINIIGNINDIPVNVDIVDLKQNGEIANEIYKATLINENILDLQMIVNTIETSEVYQNLIIDETDDLYIGQSQIIEGIKGESLVYKEITYNGLTKDDEKIINEKLIKSPVNTVIKKGTKNPYRDGITFLYRPTYGGYMTSLFGEKRGNSYHKGIDIAKELGCDVIAAFEGKVISAGYNDGGYGNLVIIEHDGNMETYYAHLSDIYVSIGDTIKKGEVIGAIGSTGYSTGPHLHFELRVDGIPVNPEPYIE